VDRRLIALPRTPIARAKPGELVKIVGKLRATAPAFTAPLSGATCIWYSSVAQVYDRWRYLPKLISEQPAQEVSVDDDTGSALVRLGPTTEVGLADMLADWCYEPPIPGDERNIATTENVRQFLAAHGVAIRYRTNPLYLLQSFFYRDHDPLNLLFPAGRRPPEKRAARYREAVLREGDCVAVLGHALQEPDPTAPSAGLRQAPLRLVIGESAGAVAVSNLRGAGS